MDSAGPRVNPILARDKPIGSRMFPDNTSVITYLRRGKTGKKKVEKM